jgi:hypothetical protein
VFLGLADHRPDIQVRPFKGRTGHLCAPAALLVQKRDH